MKGRDSDRMRLRPSSRLGIFGLAWLVACLLLGLLLQSQQAAIPDGTKNSPHDARLMQQRQQAFAAVLERSLSALPSAHLRYAAPQTEEEAPLCVVEGADAPLRLALGLNKRLQAWGRASQEGTQRSPLLRPGEQPRLVWNDDGSLDARVGDTLVQRIRFPGHEGRLGALARPLLGPSLVIVMDDMGHSRQAAEELAALPFPVTFAIWPHAPHASDVERLAREQRLDVLVHLPMQPLPRSHGRQPDPGPNALRPDMTADDMRIALDRAFQRLPSAIGFNNHMGSLFTGHLQACRQLCSLLRGQGLFVLDSVTQKHSLLCAEALTQGLVSAQRTVFLDNVRRVPDILAALDQAAHLAQERGIAIAIGHPHEETRKALRTWQNASGVAVVSLRRLVWHLASGAGLPSGGPRPR